MNADQWAKEVWTRAVVNWEERSQDHNYRNIIARPGIYSCLKSLPIIKNGRFLDIGCADGNETLFVRDSLVKLNWSGQMYGYDPQEKFIQLTKTKNQHHSIIPTTFEHGSIEKVLKENDLFEKIDLITSIFVLQDLPNIKQYLINVNKALKNHGIGIFLLVHPNFAEIMLDKGELKLEKTLSQNDEWRFAGEYPIVEERGKTFFVPYFHRTINDYQKHFQEYFKKVKFIGLKPTQKDLRLSEKNKLSPFYNHEGNVYYPEITQMKSSLIIIAER